MTVVGVVGAGVMGVGVAQSLAQHGHEVILVDQDEETLATARALITRNCRMSGLMGGPALDPGAILAQITTAVGVGALAKAAVVIENVTENWEIKRTVHESLDEVCASDTIFIANTSAIPITKIASVGRHPGRIDEYPKCHDSRAPFALPT